MVDATRKSDIASRPNREKPVADRPTVTVSEWGEIAAGMPRVSYRRGFADLLDFASPPARIAILPPDAPTVIGFARTGHAMHGAMAAFGKAKP
jgi:hypothetical protein